MATENSPVNGIDDLVDQALAGIQKAQASVSEKESDLWYKTAEAQVIYDGIKRYISTDQGEIVQGKDTKSHKHNFLIREEEGSDTYISIDIERIFNQKNNLDHETIFVKYTSPRGKSSQTDIVFRSKLPSDSQNLGGHIRECKPGAWLDILKKSYANLFEEELITPEKIVAYLQKNQEALEFRATQLDKSSERYS
jgi:hypothetical protein